MAHQPALARNPISLAGVWLTTLAALSFATYFALESFGFIESPYSGLIGFIVIPAVFILGLLLIPIGILREARRRRSGREPWHWPAIDLGHSRTRGIIATIVFLTIMNVGVVTIATVGAAHYMETDRFCGLVCHVPMKPEFTSHQVAVHANVGCVSCHIAPGAGGMVRAKMNGTRQAYEFLTNSFHRPIPTPARNIPAAAETCVRCHEPGRMVADRAVVKKEYDEDELNTETSSGIVVFTNAAHWHARPGVVVEFGATDTARETIPYVKVTESGKPVVEYSTTPGAAKPTELRRMDCLDCHSRPAHSMALSAATAVDRAIASGDIPKTLPFAKRETLAALTKTYASEPVALDTIGRTLTSFYQSTPAPKADVDRAVTTARRLYSTSVFPDMSVTWGTYKSQLGHPESSGCFR